MAVSDIAELLFPSRCLGCGALGPSICAICRRGWTPIVHKQVVEGIHIYSSIKYSTVAQRIILSSKEGSQRSADLLVVEALKRSLDECMHVHGMTLLVPIPSRRDAQRKRGRKYIESLTQELGVPFQDLLRISKRVRDQTSLSHSQRASNLKNAFIAEESMTESVILIDDIVTTGTTIFEARRALQRRGISVKGAITACFA